MKTKVLKRGPIIFLAALISGGAFSNVNCIDFSKISTQSKFVSAFQSIKENLQYYDHWTSEWDYSISKQELISQLRVSYSIFSSIPNRNEELSLLLGDIAHYLYNLDDKAYYSVAVDNYNAAIKESPGDYRTYWFIGYHYALSNVPIQAIDNFTKAQKLLPIRQPAEFWDEFAYACEFTGMPSHCIFAMDKVRSISGKVGNFEAHQGHSVYKNIVEVDKDKSYKKEEIWRVSQGAQTAFTSRPLGIKILVDSSWQVSMYDYNNHQSAFIVRPPRIKNSKGLAIGYLFAILFKSADENDKLAGYLYSFVAKYSDKRKINLFDKYDKMIAYEVIDKSMYKNLGGGHLYILGIERNAPSYPGLLLENPSTLNGLAGQITYYSASDNKDRFKGKLFYVIMLDSCEDIHEWSFAAFKQLFDNQIIIE